MSGEDDKAGPQTEVAPAYPSDVPSARPIDPWTELTPGDPREVAPLEPDPEPEDDAPPPLPGFVSDDAAAPAEETGAEIEVAKTSFADELRAPGPPPTLSDDLTMEPAGGLGPAAPPEWAEASPIPADDYVGDGPFAAPVDGPRPQGASRFTEALRAEPAPDFPPRRPERRPVGAVTPAPAKPAKALVPSTVKAELERPHRLERKSSGAHAPRTVGDMQRAARPAAPAPEAPRRHYPEMRALLKDPDAVPYGIEPPTEAAGPPVPGTFFPTGRNPEPRPLAVDLDEMLLTMAEGLLVGESADGGTEVRVTLRDEFFAGTELRIALGDGRVKATLVPPDRDIYWQLSGHAADLESRLSERGLRVSGIEVLEPGS